MRYLFDHSSLPCELIDFCCYLRGFNASVVSHLFLLIDFSRIVVVNAWALSGPFSPIYQLTLFCFQLPIVFSYQCSGFNVQNYVLRSTVVGNVQSSSDFSRDTIQLAPSIESNVPYQDVIVQMFRGDSSSP